MNITAQARQRDRDSRVMRVELGCFIEGLFFLKMEEEASFVHKTFLALYLNRMNSERKKEAPPPPEQKA